MKLIKDMNIIEIFLTVFNIEKISHTKWKKVVKL